MKITVFRNDERVHEWFLTADDPNEMSFMISNCGHGFVRYNIGEIRRMENELSELKLSCVDVGSAKRSIDNAQEDLDRLYRHLADARISLANDEW